MSGRPKNPQQWDSGNYAAGGDPWQSTPKRVDPGYRFWTPKLKAAGQFVNFFFGDLYDALFGTVNLVGQNPALNWLPKTVSSATRNMNRAAFSVKDQTWFTVGLSGGNDHGAKSDDYGRTWTDLTLGSTIALLDVACDTSGNVSIIAQATRSVYFGTRSAYGTVTFAATANALTVAPSGGALCRDDTHSTFIACYRNGTSGMKIDTSTNGTAWTARTIPAAWTSYTGAGNSPQIESRNGIAIATFYDENASLLRIMRSTDGGTTWASVADVATAFTPGLVSRPTWNDVRNVWYLTVSTVTGRQTQIWYSGNDGASWVSALSLTSNDLFAQGIIAIGELLVMANDDGRICWSSDNAATWKWVARNPQTTAGTAGVPLGLRGGGGGLLLLNAPDRAAYASLRFGSDGQAV